MSLFFLDMRNIRILVRATNWIGDSIMSLPAIEQLRENFPDAYISVLLKEWVRPIFEAHPAVDEIILYNRRNFFQIIKEIRKRRFQIAILFQNAFEAALVSFLAGIGIRVGIDKDARRFLLTHPVRRKKQHHIRNYLDIISAIGIKVKERNPVLYLKDDYIFSAEKTIIKYGIGKDDFLVGISPGAMYGPAKRWPTKYFAEIADMAIEKWNAKVIIFGSKKESEICSQVKGMAKKKEAIIDLSGRTDLATSMGIIKRCNLFLSNDSGLMHIASSLSVPTIGIFGSTDPDLTGPKGDFTKVIWSKAPCSPCFKRDCPHLECLYSITPDQVWKRMEEMRNEASSIYRQGWNNK